MAGPNNRAFVTAVSALMWTFMGSVLLTGTGCHSLQQWYDNGFKVGPNYRRPPAAVSDVWLEASDPKVSLDDSDFAKWWSVFDDPDLDGLIQNAYQQNLTLREAGFRVLQARAERAIAAGELLPQAQQLSGEYLRINTSAQLPPPFNGGTFDLPFLRREFNLDFKQAHVDLRYWLAKHGRRGGLKAIQKAFPEVRQRESMDIDGFDAVRLWKLHERGVPNALETLYTYNAEDTVVLEQLVYCALELERQALSHIQLKKFKVPELPEIPHSICPLVYRMLRS